MKSVKQSDLETSDTAAYIAELVELKGDLLESLDKATDFPGFNLWEDGRQISSRIHRSAAWRDLIWLLDSSESEEELEYTRRFLVSFSRLIPDIFTLKSKLEIACAGKYFQRNLDSIKEVELTASKINVVVHKLLAAHHA